MNTKTSKIDMKEPIIFMMSRENYIRPARCTVNA